MCEEDPVNELDIGELSPDPVLAARVKAGTATTTMVGHIHSVATGRRRLVKQTSRRQTWQTKSVATPRAAGTVEVHHPKETSR